MKVHKSRSIYKSIIKRFLFIVMMVVISISGSPLFVEQSNAAVAETGSYYNYSWKLDGNGTLTISGSGDLSKPERPVDEFGIVQQTEDDKLFYKALNKASKVVVSEGITRIGTGSDGSEEYFYDGPLCHLENVEEISLPASLTDISGMNNCLKLRKVTVAKASRATRLWSGTFENCPSLEYFEIPPNVSIIEPDVFVGTAIKTITIPPSVTNLCSNSLWGSSIETVYCNNKSIPRNAFGGSNVKTVIIGNSVNNISKNAFSDCESVNEVVFLGDYDYNSKIFEPLSSVGVYRKKGKGLMLEEYESGAKNISIPETIDKYSVTCVGEYAFDGNRFIRKVALPSSIKTVSNYAFYNCSKLNTIKLKSGITSIGKFAFYGCNSINSLQLPDTLNSIGERAFWNCYSLSTLTIPPSVNNIGANAFESCTGLTTVTIGEKDTKVSEVIMPVAYAGTSKKTKQISIKKNAFSKCKNLRKVVIGAKVKSIGKSAFYKCSSLKNIIIKTKKLKSSSVGTNAFKGINKNATIKIPKSKYKTYKKMLLKKGATKKMKFKKVS